MANLIPIIYIKIQKEVKGIGLFRKKSGKKTDGKPVAVAFVDYEQWYISMNKLYNMKPNIQAVSYTHLDVYKRQKLSLAAIIRLT